MARHQPTCCQSLLAFILKFLNYLQTFMAVCIIMYSAFMLNHWYHHNSSAPPSSPPPQTHPQIFYSSSFNLLRTNVKTFDDVTPLNLAAEAFVVPDVALVDGIHFNVHSLPKPWFIYAFMGVGVMLCCVTCIGHIAAEAVNGCCLCLYAALTTIFVLLEISLAAFIAIDRQWEEDLPIDPTGELDRLHSFFKENRDVCESVCIAVILIQVLSFLVSVTLRALVNQKVDLDNESASGVRGRPWEPLLHPHLSEASGSIRNDGRTAHSEIWSSRMREKYGLNGGDVKQNLKDQNGAVDQQHPRRG